MNPDPLASVLEALRESHSRPVLLLRSDGRAVRETQFLLRICSPKDAAFVWREGGPLRYLRFGLRRTRVLHGVMMDLWREIDEAACRDWSGCALDSAGVVTLKRTAQIEWLKTYVRGVAALAGVSASIRPPLARFFEALATIQGHTR